MQKGGASSGCIWHGSEGSQGQALSSNGLSQAAIAAESSQNVADVTAHPGLQVRQQLCGRQLSAASGIHRSLSTGLLAGSRRPLLSQLGNDGSLLCWGVSAAG